MKLPETVIKCMHAGCTQCRLAAADSMIWTFSTVMQQSVHLRWFLASTRRRSVATPFIYCIRRHSQGFVSGAYSFDSDDHGECTYCHGGMREMESVITLIAASKNSYMRCIKVIVDARVTCFLCFRSSYKHFINDYQDQCSLRLSSHIVWKRRDQIRCFPATDNLFCLSLTMSSTVFWANSYVALLFTSFSFLFARILKVDWWGNALIAALLSWFVT
jgi:hypothetical protein